MKIAFPTKTSAGLESVVFEHFGSAPSFILVDTETNEVTDIKNLDQHHEGGQCQPLKALGNVAVDAVVAGGIGAGALKKLNTGGVTVYRAVAGTVGVNLDLIKSGKLPQFTMAQTCAGHQHDGGCVH